MEEKIDITVLGTISARINISQIANGHGLLSGNSLNPKYYTKLPGDPYVHPYNGPWISRILIVTQMTHGLYVLLSGQLVIGTFVSALSFPRFSGYIWPLSFLVSLLSFPKQNAVPRIQCPSCIYLL